MIVSIIFLFIQLLFALLFFYLCIAFFIGAPFVPSSNLAAHSMIRLAGNLKGKKIYDLGSGDGKLLFLAAQKGAKSAIGIEINPFLVLWTNIRSFFSPYRTNVHAHWRNFWNTDLTDANVVFIYLLPLRMERLEKKLHRELAEGQTIVSNSFIFPHMSLQKKDDTAHVFSFQIQSKDKNYLTKQK